MFLATTTVEDLDRFLAVFSTKGAEKRKEQVSNRSAGHKSKPPPAVLKGEYDT